ncbi:MAG: CPBP family intramembrane metalloprotease [Burkholderiaceae bacterium]|jgi:membrane protease YdiL (CAAX protease family)|nr:CPBP family intramembrane metalloprotease [Burkholderiaceae bacterium]
MDDHAVGWLGALGIAAAFAVTRSPARRGPALALLGLLLLYMTVFAAVAGYAAATWAPVAAGAAVWLTLQPLVSLGRITPAELGLVPPRAGSLRPAVVVTLLVLAANVAVMRMRGAASLELGAGVVAAALLAAVIEEWVMRGALLALADRASPPRWTLWGAPLGWGGVLVTAVFVALHGWRPGLLLGVLPAAVLYLWLRARTGSLGPPIAAHLLWNLSVLLLHR